MLTWQGTILSRFCGAIGGVAYTILDSTETARRLMCSIRAVSDYAQRTRANRYMESQEYLSGGKVMETSTVTISYSSGANVEQADEI